MGCPCRPKPVVGGETPVSDILRLYAIVLIVAIVCATVLLIFRPVQARREREDRRRNHWMNKPLERFSDSNLENLERKYATPEERAAADNVAKGCRDRQTEADSREGCSRIPTINISINSGNTYSGDFRGRTARKSTKSRLAAFLLCFLFGVLGTHYFYCGRPGMGTLYLITLGFWGIGVIFDLFRIALGRSPDGHGMWV